MRYKLYTIIVVLLISSSAFAQNTRIGFGGGLTYVIASSMYTDEIDTLGENLGFKSNYHLMIKVKAGLPQQPLRFTALAGFTRFSGSRENVVLSSAQAADLNTTLHVYTLGAGVEYLLIPGPTVSPYVMGDLQLNSFGSRTFERVVGGRSVERSVEGKTKFGIGLGAGLDFTLSPQFSLDAGLKMNILNLFGKQDGEETLSTFNIFLTVLYSAF